MDQYSYQYSVTTSLASFDVDRLIYTIRGYRVMLDVDLAGIYGVLTKNLNRAVKRNIERFPADFMFQITSKEAKALRCQIGTSKKGSGGRRYMPLVFTEHGAVMLAKELFAAVRKIMEPPLRPRKRIGFDPG